MMRKFVPAIAAAALVLVVGSSAYAADAPGAAATAPYGQGQCVNFVDANGDGVCDNLGQNVPPRDGTGSQYGAGQAGAGQYGAGAGTAAGTGLGTGLGAGQAGSGAFVDANGDGVCDNLGQNVPPRDGTGSQNGRGAGQGNGGR